MPTLALPRPWARLAAAGLLAAAVLAGGCTPAVRDHRPQLLVSLPRHINMPDGMAPDGRGNVVVASPNFVDQRFPGVLAKITPDNECLLWFAMPVHPDTNRCGPMGLEFGPDGHLYVADNQYFWDTDCKSRLIRVLMKDGEPIDAEVVVEGFKLANAVRWNGDCVYVSDTLFDLPDKPGASGVYRFTLEELNNGPVKLKAPGTDPHLVATFVTEPNARGDLAGADGLAFDAEGNLYCSLFGNGDVYKITFDKDGKATTMRFVRDPRCPCGDGMCFDPKAGVLYLADSQNNAIHVIHMDGRLETLWENDDDDGSTGLLDQPCEPCVRGSELLISNFDGDFPGLKNKEADEHRTMSVIRLRR
jgi:sugar lactone lactonase YvrE